MAVATDKRLPPVDLVWRIYNARLQDKQGKHGAPARAYRELRDQHGYQFSDQWLYDRLNESEPPAVDPIAYEPAPGELEYRTALADRRKRQSRRRTGKPKRVRASPKVQDTVLLALPTEVEITPTPLQLPPMIMSSIGSAPIFQTSQNQNPTYKTLDAWVAVAGLGMALDICAISWKLSALTGHWWLLAATLVIAAPMARISITTLDDAWPNWRGWIIVFLLACFVAWLAWWTYSFER